MFLGLNFHLNFLLLFCVLQDSETETGIVCSDELISKRFYGPKVKNKVKEAASFFFFVLLPAPSKTGYLLPVDEKQCSKCLWVLRVGYKCHLHKDATFHPLWCQRPSTKTATVTLSLHAV